MSKMDLPSDDSTLRETAARWTVRRDRGLSAAESIEYELWLAADPRHARAIQRASGTWSQLDRIPEALAQRTLSEATRRRRFWRRGLSLGALAAAAAVAIVVRVAWQGHTTPAPASASATPSSLATHPRLLTLGDGTTAYLNASSEIVEQFTPAERRVLLTRGEAFFTVTKDAARPFVVAAGGLRVRAVGTAFNVNLTADQVEVLVTEGKVQLATTPEIAGEPKPTSSPPPLLEAGQRAVVADAPPGRSLTQSAIVITQVDPSSMARALAWQDDLIRLGGATLAQIVTEFQRRSGNRVLLADPALAQMRIGGRFRADDVEGFANILATIYGIDMERSADGTLVLRKRKVDSR